MHGTQELAATVATSFLRVTLVPIIDLDVIQFAAETVTAATSALAPDPCRSLTPTRRRKTSAPHPSGGGHLRELTICAGTSTWTPVNIVSNRFCRVSCAQLDRVSCAQLDRNGEVETIAHLDSERPPQRPSLCGAAAQRRIPVAARTRRPASHRTRGARTSVLCRTCSQRANETAQNGTSRRALLARGDWSCACTSQLVNRSTGLACPKLTRIACAH